MSDWIDSRTRMWASVVAIGGISMFLGLEICWRR